MSIAFTQHNHENCRKAQLQAIEARCAREGLKLTDTRRRVVEILLESHEALGAYEILSRLANEGQKAQPPIVYRALAFLTENGFAHKIEGLNAYTLCQYPERDHQAAFLICTECNRVGECCVESSPIESDDFRIHSEIIEAQGICAACEGKEK